MTTKKKKAPYGYCPTCGKPGTLRERRMNGDTTCETGHKHPSKDFDATTKCTKKKTK